MSYTMTVDTMTDQGVVDAIMSNTLTELNDQSIKTLPEHALDQRTALKYLRLVKCTTLEDASSGHFDGCSLTVTAFPVATDLPFFRGTVDRGYFPSVSVVRKNVKNFKDVLVIGTALNSVAGAWTGLQLRSSCTVYVPDALVNSYKAATNWSVYASQIKGISELPSEYQAEYQEVMAYVNH